MRCSKILVCLSVLIGVAFMAVPKDTNSVKKEQKANESEIRNTSTKIKNNDSRVRAGLQRLDSLDAVAEVQNLRISSLTDSIAMVNERITCIDDSMAMLQERLERLQKSYSKILHRMQSHRKPSTASSLSYMLSAQDVHQAYKRVRYMRRMAKWRKRKGIEITRLQANLGERKAAAEKLLAQRTSLMAEMSIASSELEASRKEVSTAVDALRKENAALQTYLKEKQQKAARLDKELEKLIASSKPKKEEKKENTKDSKKNSNNNNKPNNKTGNKGGDNKTNAQDGSGKKSVNSATSDSPAVQGTFESLKGRLPYPVEGGYKIVSAFGRNRHPELAEVYVENSGIDIELKGGSNARCVADGSVSGIFNDDEYGIVVMVRHGNYITIYANLSKTSVSNGQKLKSGQTIGTVAGDSDRGNRRILHFEIRKESEKLNPSAWLK